MPAAWTAAVRVFWTLRRGSRPCRRGL